MLTYSSEEKSIINQLQQSLPADLTYHGLHHILYVFNAAIKIGKKENINAEEMKLLRMAALYHDAGFTITYKDHEEAGCEMVKKNLPSFGYTKKEIQIICKIIMATKLPQKPATTLEKIICDADLAYLAGKDFHSISHTLFCEMKTYLNVDNEANWNVIQKKFLEKHHYFTKYGIEKLEPAKQKHLERINKLIAADEIRQP